MSSISSDCQNAELLAHSLPYRVIIVFKGSVNATTLFLFFLFYIFKGRTTIFHPNTKIIYHFICTFLFLISLHTTVVYAYEIYRLSSLINNSCDRLWWTPFFFYLRNANGDFLNGVNSSLIVINEKNGFSFQIRLVFSFFTELLGVIFFLSIHLWCLQFEKKIRAHLTLTVKFQVEETLKLTALFLPIVITKCSMQILSSTFAYFANKLWPNQLQMFR
uniref:Uncharacterized protein n=1 Tax=Ditylenchus dipsaci TaxID=166011 RepID=A0A915E5A8_9BILA